MLKHLKCMAKITIEVNWINYIGGNNSKKPAELFLAQAPVSVSVESQALEEIFSDPVFNLK